MEHQKAVNFFHGSGEVVTLLVERGAEKRIKVKSLDSLVWLAEILMHA